MKKKDFLILILFCLGLNAISSYGQTYMMATDTVRTCSGLFYDSQGSAANYNNNEDFVKTFCSDNNSRLLVKFDPAHFSFGTGDTLFVYDGAATKASLMAIYIKGSIPDSLLSTDSCLTFRFKSDNTVTAEGWAGTISCLNRDLLPQNYTFNTGSRATCNGVLSGFTTNNQMTFFSKDSSRISFDFTSLSMGYNAVYNGSVLIAEYYDYLYIYDGPTTQYPLLKKFDKNSVRQKVTGTTNALCIKFDTRSSASTTIRATISCNPEPISPIVMNNDTSKVCNAVLYDNGGIFNNMNKNGALTQTVCSDNGQNLIVTLNQNYNIGTNEQLIIYDGADTLSPILASYTYNSRYDSIMSSGTCVTFSYKTANTNTVNLQSFIRCSSIPLTTQQYIISPGTRYVCSGKFYDHEGTKSMSYPNGYGNIKTTFASKDNNRIQVHFNSFAIPYNIYRSDYLNISDYNTFSNASLQMGSYSKTSSPGTIVSHSNALTFDYVGNASLNTSFTGWDADITCLPNSKPVGYDTIFSVAPHAKNGTVIGKLRVNDDDWHQTHIASILSGNENGIFAINAGKTISVADSTHLDASFAPSHLLKVIVTDNGTPNLSDTLDVNIDIKCDTIRILPENDISIGIGKSLKHKANVTGNSLSYQWYKNGVALSSQINEELYFSNIALTDNGNYCAKVTDGCNNVAMTDTFKIIVSNTVDIINGKVGNDKIKIYPLPVKDYFIVEGKAIENIQIFNSKGMLVENIVLDSNLNGTQINASKYTSGVYLILVDEKEESGKHLFKILKQ